MTNKVFKTLLHPRRYRAQREYVMDVVILFVIVLAFWALGILGFRILRHSALAYAYLASFLVVFFALAARIVYRRSAPQLPNYYAILARLTPPGTYIRHEATADSEWCRRAIEDGWTAEEAAEILVHQSSHAYARGLGYAREVADAADLALRKE